MPNSTRSVATRLSALVSEIEAEAYARGQADARKELLDVLGAGRPRPGRGKGSRGGPAKSAAAPKRRASGRKRAPKGSVPRFVEQALRDRPGLTPQEILARAATDMERLIKLPSIRTELRNGRREGKYELNDGRWSLAATGAEAADEAEPPASDAGSGSEPGEAESSRPLGLNL